MSKEIRVLTHKGQLRGKDVSDLWVTPLGLPTFCGKVSHYTGFSLPQSPATCQQLEALRACKQVKWTKGAPTAKHTSLRVCFQGHGRVAEPQGTLQGFMLPSGRWPVTCMTQSPRDDPLPPRQRSGRDGLSLLLKWGDRHCWPEARGSDFPLSMLFPHPRARVDKLSKMSQLVNLWGFTGQETKSRLLRRYLYNKRENISTNFLMEVKT